jgi:phytoene dehydrogenase-like protein
VDRRIAKWTRWCEGTIERDVLTIQLHRHVWEQLSRIVEENESLPDSYWWEFMRDTYAITQSVAVRRQADTHKGVASLGKLIEEIRDDASRISREFWIGLWEPSANDPGLLQVAERAWVRHYAGDVGSHLDPSAPAADLDKLMNAAARVRQYVDKHVAHAEASIVPASVTLTLGNVHDAIDVLGHLFKKYSNLLTGAAFVTTVPTIQGDWQAVFRVPWIRSNPGVGRQAP